MEANVNNINEINLDKENIERIYTNSVQEASRINSLINQFNNIYNKDPDYISRAPGRVNIIGEHIDYEGFAVLPMAIENDILIAFNFTKNDEDNSSIIINSFENNKYKPLTLTINNTKEFLPLQTPHTWVNYFISGYNAIINYTIENNLKINNDNININILVYGNIPAASGLSSSSALTVCSAITIAKVYNILDKINKSDMANATINYERKVGTACGGMDQTISIFAEKNKAKLAEFMPVLDVKDVKLNKNISFVIANSNTKSTKVETLAFRYNKRVVENKLALAILCKAKKIKLVKTLYEFKQTLNLSFKQLKDTIDKYLEYDIYTIEDIKKVLDNFETIEDIIKHIPYYEEVLAKNKEFNLRNRLLHVCGEAERVEKFYKICNLDDNDNKDIIEQLGSLMNRSHMSCRDLYECSSDELDKLVKYALDNKAIGARLTGAGWGGCCVIMVKNEDLNYLNLSLEKYFSSDKDNKDNDKDNISYFKTIPGQGACLFKNNF